jgi:hypothetical protein
MELLTKSENSGKQWPEFHSMSGPQFIDEADLFSGLEFPAVTFPGNRTTSIPAVVKSAETEDAFSSSLTMCKILNSFTICLFEFILKFDSIVLDANQLMFFGNFIILLSEPIF